MFANNNRLMACLIDCGCGKIHRMVTRSRLSDDFGALSRKLNPSSASYFCILIRHVLAELHYKCALLNDFRTNLSQDAFGQKALN